MNEKWDKRFLDLATHISSWSRDPSTQVGAVIVRDDKTVVSMGFNGFPRGVQDDPARYEDRPTKYKLICHGEANAIVTASEKLTGCTIYVTPLFPCQECAKLIIQSGITRVVAPKADVSRWQESNDMASLMFAEASVEVTIIPEPEPEKACEHHNWLAIPSKPGVYVCDKCGIEQLVY